MKTSPRAGLTGQERSFDARELIVSKTDPKGVITYANETFLDVSRYCGPEVVGQPHNVIRHPRMPRGIFHLLWETISAGEELFAYIDNLAADGAHYWVLAHVTPTFDATGSIVGYHSNRRRPARQPIEALSPLYDRMLLAESQHEKATDSARAGVQALLDDLAEAGLTYDQFVWNLINGTDPRTRP